MGHIGSPSDIAKAENFMKALKQEEVDGRRYRELAEARQAIGDFLEAICTASVCTPRWAT